MARVLRNKRLSFRDRLKAGERGRVEIVSEIEPHRTNRRFVPHPDSDGMSDIGKVALRRSALLQTGLSVFLPPTPQVVQHVMTICENIAGVVKNHKAQVFLKERQCWWRHAKLQIIKEESAPAQRES